MDDGRGIRKRHCTRYVVRNFPPGLSALLALHYTTTLESLPSCRALGATLLVTLRPYHVHGPPPPYKYMMQPPYIVDICCGGAVDKV